MAEEKKYIKNDHALAHLCLWQHAPYIYLGDHHFPCHLCQASKGLVTYELVSCPKCLIEEFHLRNPEHWHTPFECPVCEHSFNIECSRKTVCYCIECDKIIVMTHDDGKEIVVQANPLDIV